MHSYAHRQTTCQCCLGSDIFGSDPKRLLGAWWAVWASVWCILWLISCINVLNSAWPGMLTASSMPDTKSVLMPLYVVEITVPDAAFLWEWSSTCTELRCRWLSSACFVQNAINIWFPFFVFFLVVKLIQQRIHFIHTFFFINMKHHSLYKIFNLDKTILSS